ncbi:Protein cfxQ [Rhynchospora pubera]|uniref:Protein cfxQ n=1 Tax=Rhynchospora pubera TaxID=906938 RepID=A0AAV8CYI9_9POAL|nr:Protein cfxQ [Rhynchospora pubera]
MDRKRKAPESCQETEALAEFEESISRIIGLQKMKMQMRKWARGMLLDEKRRAMGMDIEQRKVPHMAFLGNPGTGKTMVANILGKLLHRVGILPTDGVTVVQRTDLVGRYVGQTGLKTRKKIAKAEGGILFVDEAYRLMPYKAGNKDFGIEALEEIMSVMDEGKTVIIFAGYPKPMKRVINANEGFRRRIEKFFHFDDFTPVELAEILHLKMPYLKGYKMHPCCTIQTIASLIEKETTEKMRTERNGGLIIPWLKNARDNLDERLDFDVEDTEVMMTITLDDLEKGLHQISKEIPDEVC